MLERLYQLILPQAMLDDALEIRVSRFTVLVSIVLAFLLLVSASILYFLRGHTQIGGVLYLCAAFYLFSLTIPKLTHSIRLTGIVIVAGNLIGVVTLTLFYYPDRAVFYVWLPFVVLLATFGLGRRWGAVLVGVLMALIWQIELLQIDHVEFEAADLNNPYSMAISFSFALFMTGIVAWLFEFAHRTAEQRLFASEQKLRLHVQQTPLAVITSSPEGKVTEWNPGAERMFGYRRDEAMGRRLDELIAIPISESTISEATVKSSVDSPTAFHVSEDGTHWIVRNRTKDHDDVYCEWITTQLVGKNGEQVGVTSLALDVGERLRTEEALRTSEARFRRLTSQAPDLIVIYDWALKRITYTNRESILGRSWQELSTLPDIVAHILPEDVESIYQSWLTMEHAPEGQDTNVNEFRVFAADGSVEWIRSRESTLTRDARGLPAQMLATLTIITGEKNYEAELRRAKDEAEQLARARSQFLANMSHEIRTPMNGIIGMTSLLMNAELSEVQYDFIETIRTSSESLLTIINEILDFSKIESGRMQLEMQPVDVQESVEGALDLLAPQAANKYLELGYSLDENVPRMIMGDATRLRQILVNLVGNAVKFTDRGSVWVTVSLREEPEGENVLCFAVQDTGIGIEKEQIPQLFTAFSQLDSSSTRRYGGTGLGLAISHRLAELMGGSLWLESEPGIGSTFYFTVLAKAVADSSLPAKPDTSLLEGQRILIVEPSERLAASIVRHTRQWGMVSLEARDALSTYALVDAQQEWDVAVIDMDLPDEAGLTLVRKLLEYPSLGEKPIILMSAHNHLNIRHRAEMAGARACIYKPLKANDLFVALSVALGGQAPVSARAITLDRGLGNEYPLNILLAEDNVVNQKVALLLLDRLGYRADVAANGQEVLEAVQRQRYDLILMDVHMPEMDGVEATRQIYEMMSPSEVPYIIAMTAAAMQEDRERCKAAGMQAFISKPVKVDELVRELVAARTWLTEQVRG